MASAAAAASAAVEAEASLLAAPAAAGERAAKDIHTTTGSDLLRVRPLDLADQESVRAFVRAYRPVP